MSGRTGANKDVHFVFFLLTSGQHADTVYVTGTSPLALLTGTAGPHWTLHEDLGWVLVRKFRGEAMLPRKGSTSAGREFDAHRAVHVDVVSAVMA